MNKEILPKLCFKKLIEVTPHDTILNEENLESFLIHEHRFKNISIISIVSDSYQNSNEIIQSFLHYLYSSYPSVKYPDEKFKSWLINPNGKLFEFPNDPNENSTNLSYWNDIFISESTGIILLKGSIPKNLINITFENPVLFGLCSLISSTCLYIVPDKLDDANLQILNYAHTYSMNASNVPNVKAFQELLILVENWSSPDTFEFGDKGGEKYLLNVNELNHGCVLKYLSSSFESLKCFLMAEPKYCCITNIFERLSLPKGTSRTVKKINCKEQTIWEMINYIKTICQYVKPETEPPKFLFHTMMIENYMVGLVDKCLKQYKSLVHSEHLAKIKTTVEIDEIHRNSMKIAFDTFTYARKLGSSQSTAIYKTSLETEIKLYYQTWKKVSISLEGLIKLCILKYKEKITKEGAKDLRLSSFVVINHEKYKKETFAFFQESLSSNEYYGTAEDHARHTKILETEIESEFKHWSEVSYSMQKIIKSCIDEYTNNLKSLTVDEIRNEKYCDKKLEKFRTKAIKKFDSTKKIGTVKDNFEYRKNLQEDLDLEYENWREAVNEYIKFFDVCLERYKNNTLKSVVDDILETEESIFDYHQQTKEQALEFFDEKVEICAGVKETFKTELDKKIEACYEQWSHRRMQKIMKNQN